jgi:hypothetical protein
LVEADVAQETVQRAAVGQVALNEFERAGQRLDFAEVAAFQAGVVESVEVVEGPDGVAGMEEALANMRANETGTASNQEIHGGRLSDQRGGCRGCGHGPF